MTLLLLRGEAIAPAGLAPTSEPGWAKIRVAAREAPVLSPWWPTAYWQ